MKSSVLVMFLGLPGSGKSTFARQLSAKMKAIRLNGDSMRSALFQSAQGIERARQDLGRNEVNRQTFNALNYIVEQILLQGYIVVYDARLNKRIERKLLEDMSIKYHALPIIVWVKTPDDTAAKRTQERDATFDQPRYTDAELKEVMERHVANFELPEPDEFVIEIDGTIDFKDQFKSFTKQLIVLRKSAKSNI